jgi:hypothetical protein
MSKHEAQVTVLVPKEAALAACRSALTSAGWQVTGQTDSGVAGREIVGAFSYHAPVTIDMTAAGSAGHGTTLTLKGSNFGLGPIQSSHVKKQVQMLVDAVSIAVSRPAPPTATHAPASAGSPHSASGRSVMINGQKLSDQQIDTITRMGIRLSEGDFWYDRTMGAWGYRGGPTMGFIPSGLDLGGSLAADASNGNTGVFINGRQLPLQDVMALQQIVPMVLPGHYVMDAFGNVALANGFPLGNIWALAQSSGAPREGILSTYDKTGAVVIG